MKTRRPQRDFRTPADILRALGKLGPYTPPVQPVEEPARRKRTRPEEQAR